MLLIVGFWGLVLLGIVAGAGIDKVRKWWVRTILGVALMILTMVGVK